jgi:CubicO group peptidase (beta-lactamase class C family)
MTDGSAILKLTVNLYKQIGLTVIHLRISRLAFLLFFAVQVSAQTDKIKAFESQFTETRDLVFEDSIIPKFHILERMRKYSIPSASIAVIDQGKIAWVKSYGYADVEHQRKAEPQTLYQVASISKSINAVGVMRLVQSGKLSLSTDIRTYLRTWQFPDNAFSQGKAITLKQLLSHTAGLSVHGFVGIPLGDSIPTVNQILDGKRPANNEPVVPIFPPGIRFEYSGGGSTVIRKILDDQISNNYDSLMQLLVLRPIGMTSSSFNQPLPPRTKNFAFGYDKAMRVLPSKYYLYPEQAAGGLWSTASDIGKFILAVQQSLGTGTGLPISKTGTLEMLTPLSNTYALGFGVIEKGGEKYFYHEGQSYGYSAIYYGSFTTGQGLVVLTNAYPENGEPFLTEVVNSIATVYGWKSFYEPLKKKLYPITDEAVKNYVGEYVSEDGRITIRIEKTAEGLVLTARRPERMYATAKDRFFLASSPSDNCIFSSSKGDGNIDTFEVEQGGKVMIRAKKK